MPAGAKADITEMGKRKTSEHRTDSGAPPSTFRHEKRPAKNADGPSYEYKPLRSALGAPNAPPV